MEYINEKVNKKLKERGIIKPLFPNRGDFTTLKYTFTHPITKKEEVYTFKENDFSRLPTSERAKYRKLGLAKILDEDKLNQAKKKYKTDEEIFQKYFDAEYLEVLKELKLTPEKVKKGDKIFDVLSEYGYLELNGISDGSPNLYELEEEIVEIINE